MPSAKAQRFALGTVVFDELAFEVPENLEISRRTLGGSVEIPQTNGKPARRVTQTLGVVVDPIKFEATFLGPQAEEKARKLEAMQLQQRTVAFQFGGRSFDVVIFGLLERYRSVLEITYSVELEPQIETKAGTQAGSDPTAQLSATLQNIAVTVPPTSLNLSLPQIQQVKDAQAAAKSTNPATAALSDLQKLQQKLTQYGNVLSIAVASQRASTAAGDIATYLAVTQLKGQIGAAVAMTGMLTGGAGSLLVNPAGLNAYQIAVRYTGTIRNVDAILAANPKITDPFNVGPGPIAIPKTLTSTSSTSGS